MSNSTNNNGSIPRKDQKNKKVSIVIPALENLDLTRNCWLSIQKNTGIDYEIILVDNGSKEPLSKEAKKAGIYCIRNERNLGFAAAVNQGLRAAQGEFLVVLNNDTLVTPHWTQRLLEHFANDSRLGMLAPVTNYANNAVQRIDSNYNDETSLYQFSEARYQAHQSESIEQNKIAGVCMVIPRDVMESVGLFDTRFGIGNFEDDDYCLRVRRAGYRVAVANDVFVHHEGGCTFRLLDLDYEQLLKRNSKIFLEKWAPVLGMQGAVEAGGETQASLEETQAGLTTILVQDEEDLAITEIESILKSLPEVSRVRLVCEKSSVATLCEQAGIPVVRAAQEDLLHAVDQQILEAETTHVLVVSSRLVAKSGWVEALLESAVGMALAIPQCSLSSNESQPQLAASQGVAVLLEKKAYSQSGGLSNEFVSGVAWEELASRMDDDGLSIGHIETVSVGLRPNQPTTFHVATQEHQVMQRLVGVKKSIVEGELQQALADLRGILESKPGFVHAHNWQGILHTSLQELDLARLAFLRILELDPINAAAHNNLGCLEYTAGHLDKAVKHFEMMLELQPDNIEAARSLAHVFFESGKPQPALDLYVGIVQKAPDDPRSYVELGTWYENLGELSGAADWYRRALQVSPDSEEAQLRLRDLESRQAAPAGDSGADATTGPTPEPTPEAVTTS